ncbi:MAG: hypothetical protein AAGJ08_00055 [Cyanobacteria bacterium P01_H01_bin.35]
MDWRSDRLPEQFTEYCLAVVDFSQEVDSWLEKYCIVIDKGSIRVGEYRDAKRIGSYYSFAFLPQHSKVESKLLQQKNPRLVTEEGYSAIDEYCDNYVMF